MTLRHSSLGLGLMLVSGLATATPIPRYEDLLHAQHVPALPQLLSAPLWASTKVLAIDTQLDVAPETGALTGQVDLKIEAVASVTQVSLLIDGGLKPGQATATGKTVNVSTQAYQGYTLVKLDVVPGLGVGETVSVNVAYSGTLECKTEGCYAGKPLAFLSENGAIPGVYDQDSLGGYNAWGASRSLTLSVPEGTDVVASGDRVAQSTAGGKATSKWVIPGYHSYGGNVVMMGQLASKSVAGVSVPTQVFTTAAAPSYASEMVGWMQQIVPFLDAQAGQKLPYPELKVFKLPLGWLNIFRGTAGHGLTLLSEDYASGDVAYFQETLAHENAHQWWGVLVSPTDIQTTRWLVEGLATFSQIDYAAEVQNPKVPRDEYLARRYREHWLLVKYRGDPTLPLVVASPAQIPTDSVQNTLWAYIRSSALLEYLRVVIGEQSFATLLRAWAQDCAQKLCDTADFLALLEQTSGEKFDAVFGQWVSAGAAVEPQIGFSQVGGKLRVSATGIGGATLPLELWITLADGTLKKQRVRFQGSLPVEIAEPAAVRRVKPNPRQEGMIWSRSATPADVDFDAEVDGFDVIHCARLLGKTADPSQAGGEGIWSTDLDFDPRCDADEDGVIGDSDLAVVTGAFGTLGGGAQ
ncbi:MAG: hypothetical protein L6Q84_21805 [Polyangiaceae bacterium]|nr:hypothetical protein [Polyangiaceae bacterium]